MKRPNETQSDKTVGHWMEKQADRAPTEWTGPADTEIDEVDQLTVQDPRRRHAELDFDDLTDGAGDSDPAQSTLSRQQNDHVDDFFTHVDQPRGGPGIMRHGRSAQQRRRSTYDTINDDRDTASEPATAAESARYSRYLSDSGGGEDFGHVKSDLRHTRHASTSTKTEQRTESTAHSQQQQRSNRASRFSEQHSDADVTSRLDDTEGSRQYGHDVTVRRRHDVTATAESTSPERWDWEDGSRPHSRSTSRHDQRRQLAIDQPDDVPRRLVFRFVASSPSART